MEENIEARVYTTGQVAEICKLSPAHIRKSFDQKILNGFYVPSSGRKHRRIPHKDLVKFMLKYEIPISFLEEYLKSNH